MTQVSTIQRAALAGDEAQYHAFINGVMQALATGFAGSSAPTETYAFMNWTDTSTTPPTSRRRNAANNAWDTLVAVVPNQSEAEAGTDNVKSMTALRTKESIAANAPPAGPKSIQVLAASGTWTRPAGVKRVLIHLTGGGQGGTRGDGSGPCGGTTIKALDVSNIASATVTIGGGGAGAARTNQLGPGGGNSVWADGANTISGAGAGRSVTENGDIELSGHSSGERQGAHGYWGPDYGKGGNGNGSRDSGNGSPGGAGVAIIYEF